MSKDKANHDKEEKNFSVLPSDMGAGGFMVPLDSLSVGPGQPGPGDEWHLPSGPIRTEADAAAGDAPSGIPSSDSRPQAEKNLGLFMTPGGHGSGLILTPMNSLSVGPGEPGPGDEWHVPSEQIRTEADAGPKPESSDAGSLPPDPAEDK
jgi:hypothetical protein